MRHRSLVGEYCDGSFRADAAAPPRWRPEGRSAAAHLVEVNLGVREGDERLVARASQRACRRRGRSTDARVHLDDRR